MQPPSGPGGGAHADIIHGRPDPNADSRSYGNPHAHLHDPLMWDF